MIRGSAGMTILLILTAVPAFAQDWKSEWTKTVAAAEKEGQVFFQSQPNQGARDFLQREWAKAFPKIELQLSVTPTAQFLARIRTERQADKYLWDVGLAGFTIAYPISHEGGIRPSSMCRRNTSSPPPSSSPGLGTTR
jgi:hypothetical protein